MYNNPPCPIVLLLSSRKGRIVHFEFTGCSDSGQPFSYSLALNFMSIQANPVALILLALVLFNSCTEFPEAAEGFEAPFYVRTDFENATIDLALEELDVDYSLSEDLIETFGSTFKVDDYQWEMDLFLSFHDSFDPVMIESQLDKPLRRAKTNDQNVMLNPTGSVEENSISFRVITRQYDLDDHSLLLETHDSALGDLENTDSRIYINDIIEGPKRNMNGKRTKTYTIRGEFEIGVVQSNLSLNEVPFEKLLKNGHFSILVFEP